MAASIYRIPERSGYGFLVTFLFLVMVVLAPYGVSEVVACKP